MRALSASSSQHVGLPAWQAAGIDHGLVLWMLLLPIIGASLLSKFAVPFMPVDGIGLGFPLLYLAILPALLLTQAVSLHATRLHFFCFMAAVLGGAMALHGDSVSLPSLAFLMLLHLPYVLQLEVNEAQRERVWRFFLDLSALIACCGLAQYVLQHFIAAAYVFPIENFLPASWRVTGFNMQIPIAWGASTYRANGIFMQEPSFFSQFLAIGLLFELCGPSRWWRAALYAVAMLASQSGTGLILLAAGVPVLVMRHGRWGVVLAALLAVPLLVLAAPYLHLEQLIARIGEFGSTRSSAYERFVGGFHIFEASVGTDPLRMLFGYGAGSYREIVQNLRMPAAEMALFKMVVEFGVVGAALYFGFIAFCLLRAQGPLVIRLAMCLCLLLNGAYNTFVHSLALALLVWPALSSTGPDVARRLRSRARPFMRPRAELARSA
ncbi:MAG: hypothetical protein QM776_08480 [Rhodocyclaceae bacterium]